MGSKLTVLAAVVALAGVADANPAADAAMKKGIELYKAGKYVEAVPHLEKAQKLDPKPETLFALAQAQRLAGDCNAAAKNYHKVIEQVSDMNVGKLVQQNLALCEPDEPKPEPKPEPVVEKREEPEDEPKPQIVEKTVVHEVDRTNKLAVVMLGGGLLALGVSGGLYVAASGNADAADRAKSLEDHDLLADRATSQRTMMYIAGGVGVAMVGVAIWRFASGGSKQKADVAVVPTTSGGSLFVTSRF